MILGYTVSNVFDDDDDTLVSGVVILDCVEDSGERETLDFGSERDSRDGLRLSRLDSLRRSLWGDDNADEG